MKEIEDDINRWKDILHSQIGRPSAVPQAEWRGTPAGDGVTDLL